MILRIKGQHKLWSQTLWNTWLLKGFYRVHVIGRPHTRLVSKQTWNEIMIYISSLALVYFCVKTLPLFVNFYMLFLLSNGDISVHSHSYLWIHGFTFNKYVLASTARQRGISTIHYQTVLDKNNQNPESTCTLALSEGLLIIMYQ